MKWTGYVLDIGVLLVSGVLGNESQKAYLVQHYSRCICRELGLVTVVNVFIDPNCPDTRNIEPILHRNSKLFSPDGSLWKRGFLSVWDYPTALDISTCDMHG